MKWQVSCDKMKKKITLPEFIADGAEWETTIDNAPYGIRMEQSRGKLTIWPIGKPSASKSLEVKSFRMEKEQDFQNTFILEYRSATGLHRLTGNLHLDGPGIDRVGTKQDQGKLMITSPMTGKILKIMVENKQRVQKGDPLFIIEAMKMENQIKAKTNGIIELADISPGHNISIGRPLGTINID